MNFRIQSLQLSEFEIRNSECGIAVAGSPRSRTNQSPQSQENLWRNTANEIRRHDLHPALFSAAEYAGLLTKVRFAFLTHRAQRGVRSFRIPNPEFSM
jgi:hypothetical protein